MAATCGEGGYTEYFCPISGCLAKVYDGTPATGNHTLEAFEAVPATCVKDGTKTAKCANGCGETDTVADKGSATGKHAYDANGVCTECGAVEFAGGTCAAWHGDWKKRN